jgi:glutamine cyclotransferase
MTAVLDKKALMRDKRAQGIAAMGLVNREGDRFRVTTPTLRGRRASYEVWRDETGRVLQKVDVGRQYFAEGLALLGGSIYQLTWREGVAFVYDTAGLRPTGQRAYTGEGWGLATDGTSLIVSDGSHTLSFVDPATFAMQRTINVLDGGQPVFDLNELEYVRGEIWANVWHKPDVVRIDPQTGVVKGRINLSSIIPPEVQGNMEAVPNGIAYDEATGRLFVTGKMGPKLFEVRVPSLHPGGAGAAG